MVLVMVCNFKPSRAHVRHSEPISMTQQVFASSAFKLTSKLSSLHSSLEILPFPERLYISRSLRMLTALPAQSDGLQGFPPASDATDMKQDTPAQYFASPLGRIAIGY